MMARRDVIFWTCLGGAVLASRLCHVNVLWADEDYHLAAAIQALHGKAPYRDFWYDKPPLSLVFYLLFGARTGTALRVADAAFVCLCCALAYRLAARLWKPQEGYVAAALFAFFSIFYLIPGVVPLEPDTLMLAPHFAAVYLAWRRKPLWAGVAAGIAFQLNVKGVLVVLVAAVASGAWGAVLLGFLILNAAVLMWLIAGGLLPAYWEQVWKWGWLYLAGSEAWWAGARSLIGWAGFHAALILAAAWFWIRERSWTLWWFLAALAFMLVGLRPAPRYFNLLLPPLIIAGCRVAGEIANVRLRPTGNQPQLSNVPLIFAAGLLLLPIIRFGPSYIHPAARTDTAMDRESRQAATLIEAVARPSETIFIWGYRPDIVAYTRLAVGGRIWDSQPLTSVPADRHLRDAQAVDPAWAARNRVELAGTSPDFVVDGLSRYNPRLEIHRYPEFDEWLTHYCDIGSAGLTSVYRRCR